MAHVDLFVLGGGSGGVACARRAAAHGARVALAERSRVGGTCVIRGCVPKKLMRYGAHFADYFRIARAYGWQVPEPALEFERLLRARNDEITRLNGIYLAMLEKSGVRLLEGHGRITGRDGAGFVVEVGHERITAARVLVAVGGQAFLPDVEGAELAVTSDAILEQVYPLPRRLAVVGGGYIGLELASILAGFGAETSLVMRGPLPLRGFDEDVRTELARQLGERGLKLHPDTKVARIARAGDGLVLETSDGPLAADMVVLATGRKARAHTDGIGLDELGVTRDGSGKVRVDEAYESSVPGIYAAGDCSVHEARAPDPDAFDLTPVAIAEGRAIAERLFNANPTTVGYGTVPTAVFSLPEAASVGLTEAQARAAGHEVQVFRTSFRPMLHTLPKGAERTMMKLVVDRRSDRVLGCHMVGEEAAEIIQGLAVALTAGATKAEFDATMALHPTAAEEFVTLYQPTG